MAAVDYREYLPHPALAPFVRTYWSLCGRVPDGSPQPVLPDGTTELVVHRERPFFRFVAVGPGERQASTLFVGPMRSPVVLLPDGLAEVAAVRFRPNGAYALLGVPQHYLDDAIADVAALDIPWLRRTVRTAREASSVQAAIGCLEAGLLERVARQSVHVDARVDAVVAAIDGAAGACRIDSLAAVANSSRRHLERLFREQVGLTPKAYARVVRFMAAAARLTDDPLVPLADVSSDGGYFDQSHMIREFLAFAGRTPDQFRARPGSASSHAS
jgi:AraC-like DNA-binding protein